MANRSARLGFIMRMDSPQWRVAVCGAFLAVHHINTGNASLVPQIDSWVHAQPELTLSAAAFDSEASALGGARAYRGAHEYDAHAIVGGDRSAVSDSFGLQSAIDARPMVAYFSTAEKFADKGTYSHFARVIAAVDVNAHVMMTLALELGYDSFAVLFGEEPFGQGFELYCARYAENICGDGRCLQAPISAGFNPSDDASIDTAVLTIGRGTQRMVLSPFFDRQVVRIFNASAVQNMVTVANERSDVPFVWMNHISIITETGFENYDAPSTATIDLTRRRMNGFLDVWIQDVTASTRYDDFKRHLRAMDPALCANEVFNETGTIEDILQQTDGQSVYGLLTYDAVIALGRALHDVGDVTDGTALYSQLVQQESFEGVSGRVAFDQQGDRWHEQIDGGCPSQAESLGYLGAEPCGRVADGWSLLNRVYQFQYNETSGTLASVLVATMDDALTGEANLTIVSPFVWGTSDGSGTDVQPPPRQLCQSGQEWSQNHGSSCSSGAGCAIGSGCSNCSAGQGPCPAGSSALSPLCQITLKAPSLTAASHATEPSLGSLRGNSPAPLL